ncbi:S8 family serine peptidase [Candidatus Uhrbacteria bacterium]|nr:S8 family serine peptidase [Candidatus Uhrbacteria bacterium]
MRRHFNLKMSIVITILAMVLLPLLVGAKRSDDPFRSELWYLDKISAPAAWEVETGSDETIVAVLDAGFDLDHEDLQGQFWVNTGETQGDDRDNDRNGYEDDVRGWDFVDGDPDPSPDVSGTDAVVSHGTVIAGIIGATANNGLGITGINWDVTIMPLRVLDKNGSGSTVNVRHAIEYAVENGADVINLSFTFSQTDERLRETILWAYEQGVVVVAAIGNGGVDTDVTPIYPACFDLELHVNAVIGVAATDKNDVKASFSNFGTRCVDLSAPGTDLFTAVYHDEDILSFITSYASPWEGTSLAAPMVAGAAALLRSAYPSLTPDQVRNALKLSVDPVAEASLEARMRLGAGRLNLERALTYAATFANGPGASTTSRQKRETSGSFVVAQARGSESIVRRINGQGDILAEFQAYPIGFRGGVRLAMGDVNGDGVEEIVTGAGPSGGPQVRIFDLEGHVLGQFFAFDEGDRNGIFVSAGDVNGDGVDEILVTSDSGGTGQVRIFNRFGHLKGAYFPFGRTDAPVRVTTGNVDEDAESEILSALWSKGDGRVFVHDGNGRYVRSIVAFQGNVDALSLASVDLDADGIDELVVASGAGHSPEISVYNSSGEERFRFFGYPMTFVGGLEVASGDIDHNGIPEIYLFPTSKGGPQVRIFGNQGELIGGFFSFNPLNRFGGSIAIWEIGVRSGIGN